MPLRWGFYGKLPSQGDFVTRRLSWEFTEPWDAWMQDGLAATRQADEGRWLQHYLNAPVWRFRLRPGVAGPSAWLGLWFPSVDKVGRHFPLTVAAALPEGLSGTGALAGDDAAWQALEECALAALDPRTTLEQLEQSLGGAPTPMLTEASLSDAAQAMVTQSLAADAEAATAQAACDAVDGHAVLFFSWGSQAVSPCVVAGPALPQARIFSAFLDGRWSNALNMG